MRSSIDHQLLKTMKELGHFMRKGQNLCSPDMNKPAVQRDHILCILDNYPEGVKQKDLLKEIFVSPSTLSEMIQRLEKDGYITKKNDPKDRRATLIIITDSGKKRASHIEKILELQFKQLFKNLEDDDKEQLIYLINKMIH